MEFVGSHETPLTCRYLSFAYKLLLNDRGKVSKEENISQKL
jgi:hypothetical protein